MNTHARASDTDAIMAQLAELKPGECMIYHYGMLAFDREFPKGGPVYQVGMCAMRLSDLGKVCLTQCKRDENKYEYIATGTHPKKGNRHEFA
jgi:hypothetical protein